MSYFRTAFQNFRTESVRAFTLVETLVAVAIITIAVAGPMVTASKAALAANLSKDQLTASYLAQEGIEYVRMLRDQTYLTDKQTYDADLSASSLSETAWYNFVLGTEPTSITNCRDSVCTFDPAESVGFSLVPCSGNSCGPLYLANGIYTQKSDVFGSVKTPFTRTVRLIYVSATEERVVSTVSWMYHNQQYSVTVTDHLTSWQ